MPDDPSGPSSSDERDALVAQVAAIVRASEARVLEALQAATAAGERSTRRRLDTIFAQVEALLALRDLVPLAHPLPRTRGWAASPDLLLEIVQHIESANPTVVFELGSGVSTIVIAAALRKTGQGTLVSIEHDERFAERTREQLARQELSSVARVIHAPLGEVMVRGQQWRWYTLPPEMLPRGIDLVVVDGPPGPVGPLARYPALPFVFDRLAPRAAIILDDGARPDEREIVVRWQREFPGFDAVELPVEKGGWVLSRTG